MVRVGGRLALASCAGKRLPGALALAGCAGKRGAGGLCPCSGCASKPVPSGTAFAVASLTAKAILAWRWRTAAGDSLSLVLPLRYPVSRRAVPRMVLLLCAGLRDSHCEYMVPIDIYDFRPALHSPCVS